MNSKPTEPATPRPDGQPAAEAETIAAEATVGAPPAGGYAIPPVLSDHPRYRVIRQLGEGGMGTVYIAEHRRMMRLVALKVVNASLVRNPDTVRRFQQEVQAAARLGQHPNVVAVHDADEVGGLHYLVMEYVEGESLADYVRSHGALPSAEACDYARQAALGLQHAADHGMVHRDIKPHNLMRSAQGAVKVLDFGLARHAREQDRDRSQLTRHGVVMGTADYMAPEQANDSRTADTRADVYSLGCTLYHLLTGGPPFPDGGVIDKLLKHAIEPPPPLGERRPDLPAGVVRLVERMMAKSPADRFQTPGEAAAALAPWCGHPGAAPAPVVVHAAAPRTTPPPVVLSAVPTGPISTPPPPVRTVVVRRIERNAFWLIVTGSVYGVMAGVLACVVFGLSMSGATGSQAATLSNPAGGAAVLSTLILFGAVKMKSRQSHRWAVAAAVLTVLPVTPCLFLGIPVGLRALACLTDPEVRAAFPPAGGRDHLPRT